MRRALRQPELRGPHPRRGEGELPRIAAARRRLRARGEDGPRPPHRAAGSGHATARTSSSPTSGPRPPRCRARSPARSARRCSATRTRTSSRATPTGGSSRPGGRPLRLGRRSTYVRRPPYFDGHDARAGTVEDVVGRTLPRLRRRLGDDRPHLPGRRDQARLARGRYLLAHGVERQDFNSLRIAPRQPRGDGARHVRQRAAAQPPRPRLGGNVDRAPALRRGDDDLRRLAALPGGGGAARRPRGQGVRHRLVARLGGERARSCSA